jgi:hypothetical protein
VFKYGLLLTVVALSQNALGQTNTCGMAVAQLQSYVAQVNTVANTVYSQIPMSCGGNPYCMQGLFSQLSNWYLQQAALVNGWYSELSQQCTHQRATRPIPSRRQTRDEPGQLDERVVEDLKVDDEDKTVRIRIPSTPRGFQR